MAAQVKRLSGSGAIAGGLLILGGLSGLSINLVAGLVLAGIGILFATAGHRETVLHCPGCGAQGVTLGEIARKPGMAPASAPWKPGPEVVTSTVTALLAAVGALIWFLTLHG